jgi:hypothetical protein
MIAFIRRIALLSHRSKKTVTPDCLFLGGQGRPDENATHLIQRGMRRHT